MMANRYGFYAWSRAVKRQTVVLLFLAVFGPLAAFANCTDPAGSEGDIIYNGEYQITQFCDGTDWWSMQGTEAPLPSCATGDGIVMTSAGWACSPGGPP